MLYSVLVRKKVSLDCFLCFKKLWAPAEVVHGESSLCRMLIQVTPKTHPRGYKDTRLCSDYITSLSRMFSDHEMTPQVKNTFNYQITAQNTICRRSGAREPQALPPERRGRASERQRGIDGA